MNRTGIPKYIQWLLLLSAIFLALMTLLRIVEINVFPKPDSDSIYLGKILRMGFRYDCRTMSIVCGIFFILSLIKPLNPFATKAGKLSAFILWTFFGVLFIIFYIADFAHYAYLDARLNANSTDYLNDTKTSLGMIWESYPVIWVLLGLTFGTILLNKIVRLTYGKINAGANRS